MGNDLSQLDDEIKKVAYCHADDIGWVRARVAQTDPDATVEVHPWLEQGEAIICCPPVIPFQFAHRELMTEIENDPRFSLTEMLRRFEELNRRYFRA